MRIDNQICYVPISQVIGFHIDEGSLQHLMDTNWKNVQSYYYCRSICTGERYHSSYNYNHTFILFDQLYAQLPPLFLQYNAEYRCPVYSSSATPCGTFDETFDHEQDLIVNEFAVRWDQWVTLYTTRGSIM